MTRPDYTAAGATTVVTVVVPTRNRSAMLKRLLAQLADVAGLEVVVVDDGSRPDERDANRSYARDCGNAQLVEQERRGGAGARNAGLERVQSPFVWFIDDDDVAEREVAIRAVERLRAERPLWAVMSSVYERGGSAVARYSPTPGRDRFGSYRDRGQLASLPSMIFSADLARSVGAWDPRIEAGQDTDFVLRIARAAEQACCWPDLEVRIDVSPRPRITSSAVPQLRGKARMLVKHWRTFTWRRRLYYVATLVSLWPVWKGFSERSVAREIVAGQAGPT